MSVYLRDLIKEVEAEAEKARARLKKIEALNSRSQEQDAGALKRLMQRLEILRRSSRPRATEHECVVVPQLPPLLHQKGRKVSPRGAGAPLESWHKPACWAGGLPTEGDRSETLTIGTRSEATGKPRRRGGSEQLR